jgi:hypothetical protein
VSDPRVVEEPGAERGPKEGREAYTAPELSRLGTLEQLTAGGSVGTSDGVGSSGSHGSLP